MPRRLGEEARAWGSTARDLATWADEHLVNRRDVWGAYIPVRQRTSPNDKSRTAPGKAARGHQLLTTGHLRSHFTGERVLGLHASDGAASKWFAFDFDCHEGDAATRRANLEGAARLVSALREHGCTPLVEDSDGRGGLHVWVVLDTPRPTADVFCFAEALRARLELPCETFPKQRTIPPERFGNWLRLPGKHHTRTHWSRIAHDGRWLAGTEAVERLLSLPLTPATVIPPAPPSPVAAPPIGAPVLDLATRDRRLQSYVAKVDLGLSDGRKRAAFRLGAVFLHDFGLSKAETTRLLLAWNTQNVPPLDGGVLSEILDNAGRYGRGGCAA